MVLLAMPRAPERRLGRFQERRVAGRPHRALAPDVTGGDASILRHMLCACPSNDTATV